MKPSAKFAAHDDQREQSERSAFAFSSVGALACCARPSNVHRNARHVSAFGVLLDRHKILGEAS